MRFVCLNSVVLYESRRSTKRRLGKKTCRVSSDVVLPHLLNAINICIIQLFGD